MEPILITHTAGIFFEETLSILSSPKAYLDPGSGSFILQLVIATLLGGLFIIKGYWMKIKGFFNRLIVKNKHNREDE
jgi:hypothetical protein